MGIITSKRVSIALLTGFLLFFSYTAVNAFPVPELPDDNLIVNPWFRSVSDPTSSGFDGWIRLLTDGVTWGLSQKASNPSPDIVISGSCGFQEVYCGTAARWAAQSGILYSNIDVYAYQVVAADPSHRKLKFFTHYVSHLVEIGAVNIYGGSTADGPWELVWVPFFLTEDEFVVPEGGDQRDLWQQTEFLEWDFDQGYPYYKVELHSRLPESPFPDSYFGAGFKITGIYFAAEFTGAVGSTPPPPTSIAAEASTSEPAGVTPQTVTAIPTTPLREATPEGTAVIASETAVEAQETLSLTAEAISSTEIKLSWNHSQNTSRGIRVERSLNMNSGWESIAALGPDILEFTDRALTPDTIYYYRLRASQDKTSIIVSVKTDPLLNPDLRAPSALQALSNSPFQVELSWTESSDDEGGFQVERSVDNISFETIETLNRNTTSFVDTGLEEAVYYYRVRSFRGETFSDFSDVVSVQVEGVTLGEEGIGIATGANDDHPISTSTPEQANNVNSFGPDNFLVLGSVIITLIVGVGLGIVLMRQRSP